MEEVRLDGRLTNTPAEERAWLRGAVDAVIATDRCRFIPERDGLSILTFPGTGFVRIGPPPGGRWPAELLLARVGCARGPLPGREVHKTLARALLDQWLLPVSDLVDGCPEAFLADPSPNSVLEGLGGMESYCPPGLLEQGLERALAAAAPDAEPPNWSHFYPVTTQGEILLLTATRLAMAGRLSLAGPLLLRLAEDARVLAGAVFPEEGEPLTGKVRLAMGTLKNAAVLADCAPGGREHRDDTPGGGASLFRGVVERMASVPGGIPFLDRASRRRHSCYYGDEWKRVGEACRLAFGCSFPELPERLAVSRSMLPGKPQNEPEPFL